MSKETKLAKKEMKAAKKAAKLEKSQSKQYNKLVKKIDKKNAKAEIKASKKGKPFVPTPIPTQEEAFAATSGGGKVKKIILMIILILLIWFLVYFFYMFYTYVAPPAKEETEETTKSEMAEYDRYKNPHKITTTPDYNISDAKAYLMQVLHDCYRDLGYTYDPSSGPISYSSNVIDINNDDCYVFYASGRTYAVSVKLKAAYVYRNGEYQPITFRDTGYLY